MLSDAVAWEPFVGLAYVHVGTDSFTQSGPIAGLVSDGQSLERWLLDDRHPHCHLHPHCNDHYVMLRWLGNMPSAPLCWKQAFAFASTGIGFGIAGVPLARNSALIEAGLDFTIAPEATLGFSYAGQLAPSLQDNGIRGRLNWRYDSVGWGHKQK